MLLSIYFQERKRKETQREADNFPHLVQLKRILEGSGSPILGHKAIFKFCADNAVLGLTKPGS